MIIQRNSKFALIGHGYVAYHLYKEFCKNSFIKPIIITHHKKFHKRDIRESEDNKKIYRNIFELSKDTKIFCVNDINTRKVYNILKENKITHIFSASSRFIFKDNIINKYSNKIFNIHGALLPQERGSGTYTYRIMNGQYFCGATIHIISRGLDKGKVVLKSKKKLIHKNSLPIDFITETNKIYCQLIKLFIKKIFYKKKFHLLEQDEIKSSYFPRFFTEKMGIINFALKGSEIERFIKGCSKPYFGASCLVNFKKKNFKMRILNAKFIKSSYVHPFLYGKIIYNHNKKIKILVQDGYLLIKFADIKLNKEKMKKKLLGKTCYNNLDDIRNSYLSRTSVFKYY